MKIILGAAIALLALSPSGFADCGQRIKTIIETIEDGGRDIGQPRIENSSSGNLTWVVYVTTSTSMSSTLYEVRTSPGCRIESIVLQRR